MITEDYCSYEVAKLLKEKGFDEEVLAVYIYDKLFIKGENEIVNAANVSIIPAPTHQMAMDWLREAHNISIEPFVDYGSGDDYWWTVDISKIKKNGLITELSGYKSYKEAVEAALKYALENLI